MLAFARLAPDRYGAAMQEDRAVEWWTFGAFAAAGVLGMIRAVRARRPFDLLVALFCIFVAGEEISWGQRLFGYTPPAMFLEHNRQQEANLHNFAEIFGQPKWVLAAALAGFGVLLPAAARWRPARRLLEHIGATTPPRALAPWFAAAVALLAWYPVTFTGEWVEALAAALFLVALAPSVRLALRTGAGAAIFAVVMTPLSARAIRADPANLACAQNEADALLLDITGSAATARLRNAGSVHKRILTSAEEGFLDAAALRTFAAAGCAGRAARSAADRRRYAVDPWGTAYWMRVRDDGDGARRVLVYSFGPNRRRDIDDAGAPSDDIVAAGRLAALPSGDPLP